MTFQFVNVEYLTSYFLGFVCTLYCHIVLRLNPNARYHKVLCFVFVRGMSLSVDLEKFLEAKERRRSSLHKGDKGDSLDLANNPKISGLFAKHGDVEVVFSGMVMKVNRKNKMQRRIALVTGHVIKN